MDGFTHLRHGGRVSSTAAAIGSVLNIKPLLRVDEAGRLAVIGHGDCPDRAQALGERVLAACPDVDLHYACIGPVIGSHTGPDMLALVYWGSNR